MSEPATTDRSFLPREVQERLARVPRAEPASFMETPEDAAARAQVLIDREAERQAWRVQRFQARLPHRYLDADTGSLTPEQDPEGRVSGWLDSGHQNLVLASAMPGLGKTHAAYAVGRDGLALGQWVEVWYVAALLAAMRPSNDDCLAVLDDVLHCDVLALDDLGRESTTAWAQEQLTLILDQRLAHHRRTIVTTNLTAPAMEDRYGLPLVSRLIDDAVVVKVTGEPRRKPAAW